MQNSGRELCSDYPDLELIGGTSSTKFTTTPCTSLPDVYINYLYGFSFKNFFSNSYHCFQPLSQLHIPVI